MVIANIMNAYVGGTPQNVMMFLDALQIVCSAEYPCIVLIDEADTLLQSRVKDVSTAEGSSVVMTEAVNSFLSAWGQIARNKYIFIIAYSSYLLFLRS